MRNKTIVVIAVVLAVSTALGASAFTSATVDRSTNINVVSDSQGLIALQDGTSGNLIREDSNGRLAIDFTQASASGANSNAKFTFGDNSSGNTSYAFNMTNQAGQSHSFTLSYSVTGTDGDTGTENVKFEVYDSSNNHLGTVSESNSLTQSISAGQTVYVVLVVDTNGLTSTSDLSGTFTITV